MNATQLNNWLMARNACFEGESWAEGKTALQAYKQCLRGDWLLWAAAKARVDDKLIVRAACACARLTLPFVQNGDQRPFRTIRMAEKWCIGKATATEVRDAADDLQSRLTMVETDAADNAFQAASAACYTVFFHSYASDTAVYAIQCANHGRAKARGGRAKARARQAMAKKCADAIRKIIPFNAFNLNDP